MSARKARRLFLIATVLSAVLSLVLSSQDILAGAACGIIAALFVSTRRLIGALSDAEFDNWPWVSVAVGTAAGIAMIIGWQGYSSAAAYWIAGAICFCTAFFGNYLQRHLRNMNEAIVAKASGDVTDGLPITREDLDLAVQKIGRIVTEGKKKKKKEVAQQRGQK